ncbi:hypothetical protein CFP56_041575 [Quercus suber]|uniref:Uncharacterized protein n=1 Tax=Quercus suber TaxID=58331 RepID=A0AAW0IV45_QUESU
MVCWGIWKNRNELHDGGKGRTGRAVVRSALMLLEEYQRANESSDPKALEPSHFHISKGRGTSQPMYWPNTLVMWMTMSLG